jgi:hypothetical protein
VSLGYEHTCAVSSDGALHCWGRDISGEVSGPNSINSVGFTQVAAGAGHTCALRDGRLMCWGTDEWDGEVTGPNEDASTDYTQVMAAAYQTCGLHEDTSITCWGDDTDGQVSGANRDGQVSGANRDIVNDYVQLAGSIEADGNYLCGLLSDGTVSCWGNDSHGQISGLDALARRPR